VCVKSWILFLFSSLVTVPTQSNKPDTLPFVMNSVRFSPPSSSFTPSFWEKLYENKLNLYKLSNDRVQITAFYSVATENRNGEFHFTEDSFVYEDSGGSVIHGELQNVNSLEEFLSFDKMQLLNELSLQLVSSMMNKESVLKDPKLLQRFFLLTFADLKSYKFYYWFCQPAIVPESSSSFTFLDSNSIDRVTTFPSLFGDGKLLRSIYDYLFEKVLNNSETPFLFLLLKAKEDTYVVKSFSSLEEHIEFELYVVILDQSKGSDSFGWNIRNVLAFLAISFPNLKSVKLIGIKNPLINNRRQSATSSTVSLHDLGVVLFICSNVFPSFFLSFLSQFLKIAVFMEILSWIKA
jgi:ubiquitin-like modifier-activating enzyme ATG7